MQNDDEWDMDHWSESSWSSKQSPSTSKPSPLSRDQSLSRSKHSTPLSSKGSFPFSRKQSTPTYPVKSNPRNGQSSHHGASQPDKERINTLINLYACVRVN